ncbi:hypothetical protein DPMN_102886 [Dreissena polymorpha]|uniref:Uncharacterized protein n=1 Tax=Dreissena polymorpha TaxID=45954 RepID=A0A9D4H6V1_DREPO|nr:hypothetical protein DPMN_102886 [Dreissena polymorpha]
MKGGICWYSAPNFINYSEPIEIRQYNKTKLQTDSIWEQWSNDVPGSDPALTTGISLSKIFIPHLLLSTKGNKPIAAPQKAHRQQSSHYYVRHTLITNLPANDKFTMFQPILCGVSVVETSLPLTQSQHGHTVLSLKALTSRHLETDNFKNIQGMDHNTELTI